MSSVTARVDFSLTSEVIFLFVEVGRGKTTLVTEVKAEVIVCFCSYFESELDCYFLIAKPSFKEVILGGNVPSSIFQNLLYLFRR